MGAKILLFSFFSILIFSCKSDDEASGMPSIPADQKFLDRIVTEDGIELLKMEYNADKTIKKIIIEGGAGQIRYAYDEQGRVQEMYFNITGQGTITTYFEHDANGKILGYAQNNEEFALEISNDNYIFFNDGDLIEAKINSNLEIDKFTVDGEQTYNYFYETGRKGVFTNTNDVGIYNFIATPYFHIYLNGGYNLFKTPLEEILGGSISVTHQNEFDDQGFLKKSSTIFSLGGEPIVNNFIYEYIQL